MRYDHSVGDRVEPTGGHGTKVAGIALGSADHGGDDEANGVAEGAKLHLFDIQEGTGKLYLFTNDLVIYHFLNCDCSLENFYLFRWL